MHLTTRLTDNIEIGAVRVTGQDGLEIVTTDGGNEVRNARYDTELRSYEIAMPTCNLNGNRDDYDSVRQMWEDTERGVHTFDFYDFIDEEVVQVRFDAPLQITAPASHLRKIDTFTIKEVRG